MQDELTFGIPSDLTQCHAILSCIGEKLEKKSIWKMAGQCIFNLLGHDGFSLFERYTPERYADILHQTWNSFEKTRHGLASLKMMASRANPTDYDNWVKEIVSKAALESLQPTSGMTEIADIFKFMYDHSFICVDCVRQSWYQFTGTKWEALSGGNSIQQKFSRVLAPLYFEIYAAIKQSDPDDPEIKGIKNRCVAIVKGLKDPGFKAVLMKECSQTFYNSKFMADADENHYITSFPNGILDLHTMEFREAYPDDWTTLQMGVPYIETLSMESPGVKYVMDFHKKVLFKPDLIDFALKFTGTCLMGGNQEKKLIMNIGAKANNGKTTRATYDRYVFGTYSGKLPLGVLVGKTPDATTANPALAGTKGTRLQQLDEADKRHEFNVSFLKTGTGNDEFWTRPLFSNGFMLVPQFTLVMYMNCAPSSMGSTSDNGLRSRLVSCPHDSVFSPDAPESEEEQWKQRHFKADPQIMLKLKKYGAEYVWILVEYLKKYKAEGLKLPEEVLKETAKYHYSNDVFLQFKETKLEVSERQADFVHVNDMYTCYKQWFHDTNPGRHVETREDFSKEMIRLLGEPVGDKNTFKGLKMKTEVKRYDRNE